MSDRNEPIYNLTPLAITYLFTSLENNGRQFLGGALNIGNYPLTVVAVEKYIPAGKHHISVGKRLKKTCKVINVYELKDGTWIYSTPDYKLRKVNGSAQRSVDDLEIILPSNALAVYQVEVSWVDDLCLDNIDLGIVKYVQQRQKR